MRLCAASRGVCRDSASPARAESPMRLKMEKICALFMWRGYGNPVDAPRVVRTEFYLVLMTLSLANYCFLSSVCTLFRHDVSRIERVRALFSFLFRLLALGKHILFKGEPVSSHIYLTQLVTPNIYLFQVLSVCDQCFCFYQKRNSMLKLHLTPG